jgi:hypothetical protein
VRVGARSLDKAAAIALTRLSLVLTSGEWDAGKGVSKQSSLNNILRQCKRNIHVTWICMAQSMQTKQCVEANRESKRLFCQAELGCLDYLPVLYHLHLGHELWPQQKEIPMTPQAELLQR